jgi:hypothetical protein
MRSIAAGQYLARDLDLPLRVLWQRDAGLGARFDALFRPLAGVSMLELEPRVGLWSKLKTQIWAPTPYPVLKSILNVARRWKFDAILDDVELTTEAMSSADAQARLANKTSLLVSYCRFYAPTPHAYPDWLPVPALAKRIEQERTLLDSNTVGVHIRRTDHVIIMAQSPVDAFCQAMYRELDSHPQANFFLATDCEQTESELQAEFGGQLRTRNRAWGRDSVSGLEDAVLDLYLLAATRKLLGSHGSSFSHTAAEIGAIEEHTVYGDSHSH